MTTSQHRLPLVGLPLRSLWTAFRDDLDRRHAARSAHRELRRELSSYTTTREISDLLDLVEGREDDASEEVRRILVANLQREQDRTAQVA